jgi:hypothetical protein
VLRRVFGYGHPVLSASSAAQTAQTLTLGALHRSLLAQFDPDLGMRVGIHFEERNSVVVEHAPPGSAPERVERRTFEADLLVRQGVVSRGTLTAGAVGATTVTVRVAEVDGLSRYSVGGSGYGVLKTRPHLFDIADFQARLDAVPVGDAIVDLETPRGRGRIVLDAAIDTESFAHLLSIFGANEPSNPELPLLSHSVTLSAGDDVTLDYWWSLLGIDENEGRPARNNVIVCHVEVSVAAAPDGAHRASVELDAALRPLDDLDAVWELARQTP